MPGKPTRQSYERPSPDALRSTIREHIESPASEVISRRQVSAPTSGQLINVVFSRDWKMQCVVWDQEDWQSIPVMIRELLIQLKREVGKSTASKFLISIEKR
jgi:hypothetical protein